MALNSKFQMRLSNTSDTLCHKKKESRRKRQERKERGKGQPKLKWLLGR